MINKTFNPYGSFSSAVANDCSKISLPLRRRRLRRRRHRRYTKHKETLFWVLAKFPMARNKVGI